MDQIAANYGIDAHNFRHIHSIGHSGEGHCRNGHRNIGDRGFDGGGLSAAVRVDVRCGGNTIGNGLFVFGDHAFFAGKGRRHNHAHFRRNAVVGAEVVNRVTAGSGINAACGNRVCGVVPDYGRGAGCQQALCRVLIPRHRGGTCRVGSGGLCLKQGRLRPCAGHAADKTVLIEVDQFVAGVGDFKCVKRVRNAGFACGEVAGHGNDFGDDQTAVVVIAVFAAGNQLAEVSLLQSRDIAHALFRGNLGVGMGDHGAEPVVLRAVERVEILRGITGFRKPARAEPVDRQRAAVFINGTLTRGKGIVIKLPGRTGNQRRDVFRAGLHEGIHCGIICQLCFPCDGGTGFVGRRHEREVIRFRVHDLKTGRQEERGICRLHGVVVLIFRTCRGDAQHLGVCRKPVSFAEARHGHAFHGGCGVGRLLGACRRAREVKDGALARLQGQLRRVLKHGLVRTRAERQRFAEIFFKFNVVAVAGVFIPRTGGRFGIRKAEACKIHRFLSVVVKFQIHRAKDRRGQADFGDVEGFLRFFLFLSQRPAVQHHVIHDALGAGGQHKAEREGVRPDQRGVSRFCRVGIHRGGNLNVIDENGRPVHPVKNHSDMDFFACQNVGAVQVAAVASLWVVLQFAVEHAVVERRVDGVQQVAGAHRKQIVGLFPLDLAAVQHRTRGGGVVAVARNADRRHPVCAVCFVQRVKHGEVPIGTRGAGQIGQGVFNAELAFHRRGDFFPSCQHHQLVFRAVVAQVQFAVAQLIEVRHVLGALGRVHVFLMVSGKRVVFRHQKPQLLCDPVGALQNPFVIKALIVEVGAPVLVPGDRRQDRAVAGGSAKQHKREHPDDHQGRQQDGKNFFHLRFSFSYKNWINREGGAGGTHRHRYSLNFTTILQICQVSVSFFVGNHKKQTRFFGNSTKVFSFPDK